jgi:hypothetical protein
VDSPETWLGLLALLVTTMGGVAAAWLGRERRQELPLGEADPPELAGADLSTLAGIAQVVSRQSLKISALEARVAAQGRYQRLLETTLRAAGLPVPTPDPEDEPLIRG